MAVVGPPCVGFGWNAVMAARRPECTSEAATKNGREKGNRRYGSVYATYGMPK